MAEDKIKDEFIEAYVNKAITEEILRNLENGILEVLKSRYEFYPTEINNKEWLDYTNFICQRRSQQEFKKEMAEDKMNSKLEIAKKALFTVLEKLDSLASIERSGREYTIDEYQYGDICYIRDLADEALREIGKD